MKFERLEITGFGKLHDVAIDFSPSVTVIVGNNEAGKSTLQRALRAALYGLDTSARGDRNEWSTWQPWGREAYGLIVLYSRDDGRRYRLARNLADRRGTPQLVAVGEGELPVQEGKNQPTPGEMHVGLSESVWLATACLTDAGLSAIGATTKTDSGDELREVLSRVADTAGPVTARAAIALLEKVQGEVGTPGSPTKPLRRAQVEVERLARLREEAEEHRRTFFSDYSHQQDLSVQVASLVSRIEPVQRQIVARKIAQTHERIARLETVATQLTTVEETLAATIQDKDFPQEIEGAVVTSHSELVTAQAAATAAQAEWEPRRDSLDALYRRRTAIATERAAAPQIPLSLEELRTQIEEIGQEFHRAMGALDRLPQQPDPHEGDRLRKEIAQTKLGSVPAEFLPELPDLIDRVAAPSSGWWFTAAVASLLLGLVAAGGAVHFHVPALFAIVVIAVALAIYLVQATLRRSQPLAQARAALLDKAPGLDLAPVSLKAIRERLPEVTKLHAELALATASETLWQSDEEAMLTALEDIVTRAKEIAASCHAANSHQMREVDLRTRDGLEASFAAAQLDLAAVVASCEALDKLGSEDATLLARKEHLEGLRERATVTSKDAVQAAHNFDILLARVGIDHASAHGAEAVATFAQRCDARRSHDKAFSLRPALTAQMAEIGTTEDMERTLSKLRTLAAKSGLLNPQEPDPSADADPENLAAAEHEHEVLQGLLSNAEKELQAVTGRIAGRDESRATVAQIDEQLSTARAYADQLLFRHKALEKAKEILTSVSRSTHAEIAPHLASQLQEHIAHVTRGRYVETHVAADSFAITVRPHDGVEMRSLSVLSHGTRDQISLLMRLALIDVMTHESVPIVLDEPFITSDAERRRNVIEVLGLTAGTHQIIVTTTDVDVAQQITEAIPDATIVTLPTPAVPTLTAAPPSLDEPTPDESPVTPHRPTSLPESRRSRRRHLQRAPSQEEPVEPAPADVASIISDTIRSHPVRRRR